MQKINFRKNFILYVCIGLLLSVAVFMFYPKTESLPSTIDEYLFVPAENEENSKISLNSMEYGSDAFDRSVLVAAASDLGILPPDDESDCETSSGNSSNVPKNGTETSAGNPNGEAIVEYAKKFLGVPYKTASMNPSAGFDCSGFALYVYRGCGINMQARSCEEQYIEAVKIKEPSPGDLIFFDISVDSGNLGHVGIYIGDNLMIHAGNAGIVYADITQPYWALRIRCYGRII